MSVKCFGQLCSEPDSFGQFWTSKTCLNYKSNSLQQMIPKNDSQKYVSKMFQTDMFSAVSFGQLWTVSDSFGRPKPVRNCPKQVSSRFLPPVRPKQVLDVRKSNPGSNTRRHSLLRIKLLSNLH